MKKIYLLTVVFLFLGGLFSVNAQDLISLRDGTTIQAKVMEINPGDIKYKRFDNQNGPTITIPSASVLSIKYPNGVVDVINTPSPDGGQWLPAQLQAILNTMPAITIAGNSLKFQFNGDRWTALLNGENFSTGIIEIENTAKGSILTLKQTHIWPGAAVKTAGKVAKLVPGGAAVAGALDTAEQIAGVAGAVEAPGKAIVLEYIAGPPAKLSFVKSITVAVASNAVADDGHIILENVGFKSRRNTSSTIKFNINREDIEGKEREVLNINGSLGGYDGERYAELYTDDKAVIEQLVNGSGIRFKAIGDGKSWYLQLRTGKNTYPSAAIKTEKDKIVEIDIPYSKLGRTLNREKITALYFGMGLMEGNYSMKIFDFEVY